MEADPPVLAANHPIWTSSELLHAARSGSAGDVIRIVRRASDLTLADLGLRCGYSASTVSRLERGHRSLQDITVRRCLGEALGVPGWMLGLAEPSSRHDTVVAPRSRPSAATLLAEGGDPMRRRTFLAGAASAAAAAAGLTGADPAADSQSLDPVMLAATASAEPLSRENATAGLDSARKAYADSRYAAASACLPGLLAGLHAAQRASAGSARTGFSAMLAQAYGVASSLATKYGDDAIALAVADRGLAAAHDSGDPMATASATHVLAIAMRRDGHRAGALQLLTAAAGDLDRHNLQTDEALGAYGNLLCTAAYAAAQSGDRASAETYLKEATAAASHLSGTAHYGPLPFNPSTVSVYHIGVFSALGDTGDALAHAAKVVPAQLPTTERHGRFLVDTARAWNQHGRPDKAVQALLATERHAPGEMSRLAVRDLVASLLYAPTALTAGLRDLATRIGVG